MIVAKHGQNVCFCNAMFPFEWYDYYKGSYVVLHLKQKMELNISSGIFLGIQSKKLTAADMPTDFSL